MKRINIFIVALLATFTLLADEYGLIRTPNGTAIIVTYREEYRADYIHYLTEATKANYPNANCRGNASNRYNGHCYAWHMQYSTDMNKECWLDGASVSTYWEDGSFVSTTSDSATVIHYMSGDHSAVKSWINPSWYISKWDDGPLMEHAPEYGPFRNMHQRSYYKRNEGSTTNPGDTDEPDEPESPEITPGVLMPGYGDYLRNREYEFYPRVDEGAEMDDKYIYIWTISEEMDNGRDAVELGKATLDNEEYPHIAKVTFLTSGMFTISVEVYTGDDEFVNTYTCQAFVQ